MNEVMHAWPPRLPSLQHPRPGVADLPHCLLLAALLHLWLVLVLGNAPGGTAEPGQGVWGTINVRLRGPVSEQPNTAPPMQVQPEGAPGLAAAERWGGAVRSQAPSAEADAGAARLGTWGPQPEASATTVAAAVDAKTAAERPAMPGLPAATPPSTSLAASDEQRAQDRPAVTPEPQAAEASLRTRLPAAGPQVEPLPVAPAWPAQAATPLAELPLPAAAAPPPAQPRVLPAPLAPPNAPRAVPALPAAPTVAALPVLDAVPAPVQAAPLRALKPAPVAVPPMSAPLARTAAEPGGVPLPEITAPQPMPALSPPPPEPALRPLTTARPLAEPLPAGPQALPLAAMAPAPAPSLPPVPGPSMAVDAGARVGHDVATPASNAASAVPRLNLELSRPRGGELSRGSALGSLPLLPRPPELDDKLAREIQKATRQDCRKAYAESGLLAVLPLAADALGKSGACKW